MLKLLCKAEMTHTKPLQARNSAVATTCFHPTLCIRYCCSKMNRIWISVCLMSAALKPTDTEILYNRAVDQMLLLSGRYTRSPVSKNTEKIPDQSKPKNLKFAWKTTLWWLWTLIQTENLLWIFFKCLASSDYLVWVLWGFLVVGFGGFVLLLPQEPVPKARIFWVGSFIGCTA